MTGNSATSDGSGTTGTDDTSAKGTRTSMLALKLAELVVLLKQVCPFVVIITLQLQ